jgi:hypothetical protein
VTVAADDPGLEDTLGEVTRWFFDDYLSRYISVVNGTSKEGPEFILDYWGYPLHVSSPGTNLWLTEPQDVTGMLAGTQARLREAGYTHTAVLDSRVTVFHPGSVAIEVIWSRRAGETEIEPGGTDPMAQDTGNVPTGRCVRYRMGNDACRCTDLVRQTAQWTVAIVSALPLALWP